MEACHPDLWERTWYVRVLMNKGTWVCLAGEAVLLHGLLLQKPQNCGKYPPTVLGKVNLRVQASEIRRGKACTGPPGRGAPKPQKMGFSQRGARRPS